LLCLFVITRENQGELVETVQVAVPNL
jgi:hypothetical protein